jgi:pimeloyl-ACP methyl ester carboxylesterase
MQNVYFISGMGADKRAFQFLDLGFCNPVFVEWITPLRGENISDYAIRLKEQIHDKEPVIVGLSFGGIIALEIAKKFAVKKVVLLSSVKTEKEIPFYFRFLRYFPIHRAMSASFLRSANQFVYRCMGLVERKDKLIFREMMKQADDHFVLWAIDQVIHWKNKSNSGDIVHIHGTNDILLPYRYVKAQHSVAGGEHLMPLLKAEIISKLLQHVITGSES